MRINQSKAKKWIKAKKWMNFFRIYVRDKEYKWVSTLKNRRKSFPLSHSNCSYLMPTRHSRLELIKSTCAKRLKTKVKATLLQKRISL